MGGDHLQVYIALPNRAGNDFVAHLISLPSFAIEGSTNMLTL
jgi:hypothetical protein